MANRWGNSGNSGWLYVLGTQKSLQMMTSAMKLKAVFLLPERKAMTNLDSMLKIRDTALPTKVHLVKAMVFQVVMYERESWTIKKVECRRIDAFELWYWTRLLRVPWTARKSNQSILKKMSWIFTEGLMMKLKLQIFGHWYEELTHLKRPWCWERLGAGGGGDDRGWDCWMASPSQWTWVCNIWELVMDREAWCAEFHRVAKSWIQLSDWTDWTTLCKPLKYFEKCTFSVDFSPVEMITLTVVIYFFAEYN